VKRLGVLILLVMLLSPGEADSRAGDWNVYWSASAVNRITCLGDSLWCATNGGILLFNLSDSTFTQYGDGLGFHSASVTAVAVDRHGSVWLGFTSSGVARVDGIDADPLVQVYREVRDGLVSDSVTCLVAVEDDVYYGSTNGVAKFYDNLPSPEFVLSDSTEGTFIYDLLIAGDSLWIGRDGGVALFNRDTYSYTYFPIGSVTSLCEYDGDIYGASENGIQRFTGAGWSIVGSIEDVPIAVAAGGGVLACVTVGAAYVWSGVEWTDISGTLYAPGSMKYVFRWEYRISWSRDILKTLAVDGRGTPWVGGAYSTQNRGTYITAYIDDSWWNRAPALLSESGIVELDFAPDGGLWVSTRFFGISYRSTDGRWVSYTKYRGDVGDRGLSYFQNNLALLADSQGFLWCNALDHDLDMIEVNDPFDRDDDEWRHFTLNEGTITSNRFVKAKEDPAGNRWFLSDAEQSGMWGINITNPDTTDWLSINPDVVADMAGGSVFDCVFDQSGRVYLALKNDGVQMWDTRGFDWTNLSNLDDDYWPERLIHPDDLASKNLLSIARGSDGSIWVGTASGLVRWRSGAIDSITRKTGFSGEGLIGAIVSDLEFDGSGNLWVATEHGLNRIDRVATESDLTESDLEGHIAAFTTVLHWEAELQYYPTSVISGLPSHLCWALAYDESEDVLWIGTDNGLARLDVSPPVREEIPLSEMILYPNPIHISRGDRNLLIGRITSSVHVQVYTLEGELVHEAYDVSEGEVAWDLLTLNGYQARSGIYIVRVSDGNHEELRKIAVIR